MSNTDQMDEWVKDMDGRDVQYKIRLTDELDELNDEMDQVDGRDGRVGRDRQTR